MQLNKIPKNEISYVVAIQLFKSKFMQLVEISIEIFWITITITGSLLILPIRNYPDVHQYLPILYRCLCLSYNLYYYVIFVCCQISKASLNCWTCWRSLPTTNYRSVCFKPSRSASSKVSTHYEVCTTPRKQLARGLHIWPFLFLFVQNFNVICLYVQNKVRI